MYRSNFNSNSKLPFYTSAFCSGLDNLAKKMAKKQERNGKSSQSDWIEMKFDLILFEIIRVLMIRLKMKTLWNVINLHLEEVKVRFTFHLFHSSVHDQTNSRYGI